MTSRKNAMLTTEDRRWLTGEKTYEGQHAKQQRYQRRNDIRERVYNSILDFTILFEELDDERAAIFGDVIDDGRRWVDIDREFRDGIRDALAFLLRGIAVRTLLGERSTTKPRVAGKMIELALSRAGQRDGFLVEDVELEIEATEVSVPELVGDLESGANLTPADLYFLMERGAVDSSVVQECLREGLVDIERGRGGERVR